MRKASLFIEELESRVAPMCILPEHGNPPCHDVVIMPYPSPNEAALANANYHSGLVPVFTTLAIGEETGGW